MTDTLAAVQAADLASAERKKVEVKPASMSSMMRVIREKTGKSGFAQQMEAWRLYRGPGRIPFADYFAYRLYDDQLYTPDAKREFISELIHWPICAKCADPNWRAATEDKWFAYAMLARAGIRVPRTMAVVDRSLRTFADTSKISSAADLETFLGAASFPIFAKPNGDMGSFGAFKITGFSAGLAHLSDGRQVPAQDLLESIIGSRTYLLQAVIENHPDIARFATAVPTVRTMNLVWADRIDTPITLLKIPAAGNVADNYWRSGNLLANVDPASGEIRRVVSGSGPDLQEHASHPETGQKPVGLKLPMWSDLLAMNEAASRLYAAVRYQSLDIALTPDGPCVVEINSGGSFKLPQLATGRGFLTPRVRAFFESAGWKFR